MKKIIYLLTIPVLMGSCTKEANSDFIPEENGGGSCYFACYISDKYTGDSIFVVRDTLWKDECLTLFWWEKTKAVAASSPDLLRHCVPFMRNGKLIERERTFYVLFKNENHPPKIY